MTERITPQDDSFFSSHIKDSFKINKLFKTDPSLLLNLNMGVRTSRVLSAAACDLFQEECICLDIDSEAGRRALIQRRAGGHWVRGDPVAWSPANGAPRGAATRELGKDAGGLGRATAGDGYLPRSAGMRARGQWTRGTRGDPAELPRRLAVGYGGNDERRLPCRGTDIHKHWNKIKTFQNGKQNGVNGRRLRFRSGLLSRCTHEGGTGTRRRGYKLKW